MGIYKEVLGFFNNSRFDNNIISKKNHKECFCDFIYKGQVVLRVTDCDDFCVLESPILITNDSYGHSIVLLEFNRDLLTSVINKIDKGIKNLKILLVVMQDRFPYYKKDKSLYFKVESVIIELSLEFGNWKCKALVTPSSSFSYLNVVSNLCEDFCNSVGCGLSLDIESNIEVSKAFL